MDHLRNRQQITHDVIGFAAHWAWIWCVFWSRMFYDTTFEFDRSSVSFAALEPLWTLSLLSNLATLAGILILMRLRNCVPRVKPFALSAAVFTSFGTLFISSIAASLNDEIRVFVNVIGFVLTGVGSAIIVFLWAKRFVELGPRRLVWRFVGATMLAAAVYVVVLLLPLEVGQALVATLPLVSAAFYLRQSHGVFRAFAMLSQQEKQSQAQAFPVVVVLVAFAFNLSFGIMKGMMAPSSDAWIELRDALNLVAIVCAAAVVCLTSTVFRMDFDHLTYQVALPLMAAGFLFLPLREPLSVFGTAIHQFGYQYFYIVLWAIWSALVERQNASSSYMVGWGLFSTQTGQFVGSLAADFAQGYISSDLERAMFSAVVVFALLLVTAFVFGNRSANTGWGFIKPMEEDLNEDSLQDKAIGILSRRFRLTSRENDVFVLLSHGRNRAYIKSELVIGDETVKSHIKSIYRKLDVHSQQELISMVESEIEETKSLGVFGRRRASRSRED